ncbi:DUF397 domain-containing protein [Streptomyces sp. NPDC096136]|uniref:DUF397 domain-containing protein n=1 Tax=Streptomyces sp. NPDC096136 TaxID=3366076 RepID=UPI003823E7B6
MSTTLEWFKSSYSGDEGGQCLEVATTPTTVHVRDSKVPDGPALGLAPASWAALTGWVSR